MNTERQIITAVKSMREAQREYFRTRTYESLKKSKQISNTLTEKPLSVLI